MDAAITRQQGRVIAKGQAMSRAGRKRKHDAKRKPCGRLAQVETRGELRPEEVIRLRRSAARQQPHRLIVGDDAVHFPECETPIGCLFVIGAIPPGEFAAAQRLAAIVRRYREVLDCPRIAPSIAGYMQPGGGSPSPIDDATERRTAFAAARKAIALAGEPYTSGSSYAQRSNWDLLVDMAADAKPCPARQFKILMIGLRALRAHFRAVDKENDTSRPAIHTILEEVT